MFSNILQKNHLFFHLSSLSLLSSLLPSFLPSLLLCLLLFHLLLISLSLSSFSLCVSLSLSVSFCLSLSRSLLSGVVWCVSLWSWSWLLSWCCWCGPVCLMCVLRHAEKTWKKPVCGFKKRLRVYIQNVPVYAGTTRTCVSTCARGASTHGDVLNVHTGDKGSSPVLLTRICLRMVITCFRGSPKKLLDLSHFQV